MEKAPISLDDVVSKIYQIFQRRCEALVVQKKTKIISNMIILKVIKRTKSSFLYLTTISFDYLCVKEKNTAFRIKTFLYDSESDNIGLYILQPGE